MSDPSRRGRVLLVVAGLGGGALLMAAAMQGTLTYARTPADLQHSELVGRHVRVEGVVVPDTLLDADGLASFVLEGDGGRVQVRVQQAPVGAFREGQGAVVEGELEADGMFAADRVIAQHSNVYRAAPGGS